ncbi:MAG: hypothetical protein BWY65_01940 [Firmicutes bacterium ADurb.Bin373]|nr:MAG: hypothetical protein BWY65_01940 [Firmicutes bacterium ADurb.Bin373]
MHPAHFQGKLASLFIIADLLDDNGSRLFGKGAFFDIAANLPPLVFFEAILAQVFKLAGVVPLPDGFGCGPLLDLVPGHFLLRKKTLLAFIAHDFHKGIVGLVVLEFLRFG